LLRVHLTQTPTLDSGNVPLNAFYTPIERQYIAITLLREMTVCTPRVHLYGYCKAVYLAATYAFVCNVYKRAFEGRVAKTHRVWRTRIECLELQVIFRKRAHMRIHVYGDRKAVYLDCNVHRQCTLTATYPTHPFVCNVYTRAFERNVFCRYD